MSKKCETISREPSMTSVPPEIINKRLEPTFYMAKFLESNVKIKEYGDTSSFQDICKKIKCGPFGSKVKSKQYCKKGVPFLRAINFDFGLLVDNELTFIPPKVNKEIKSSECYSGDLIFSQRGNVGTVGILPNRWKKYNISANMILVRLKEEYDPYFYLIYFLSQFGQYEIERRNVSTTLPKITTNDVKEFWVVKPSSEIQKYIGDKVRKAEKLREEAKKIREKAEKKFYQIVKFNDYTYESQKSYNVSEDRLEPYLEANYYKPKYLKFYDYLNNLEFEVANLNDILAEKPQKSNSPAKKKRVNDGIPSLIVSDIDPYEIELEENKISVSKELYKEREGSQLREDDVIFTTAGPPLGETTIIVEEALPLLHGSHVTAFRCNETCHPGYLTLFLNSELGRIQTKRHCYGIRQKYLFNKQLYKFKIVLLPKELQKELGDMIINSIKMEFESKQLIEEAKQDVEDLIEGNLEIDDIE